MKNALITTNPKTVLEVLVAAKAILSDKNKWIKGYFAEDERGQHVPATDDSAERFCSLGAVWKVTGDGLIRNHALYHETHRLLALTISGRNAYNVSEFNDDPSTTHEDVLRMFDAAIERARNGKA